MKKLHVYITLTLVITSAVLLILILNLNSKVRKIDTNQDGVVYTDSVNKTEAVQPSIEIETESGSKYNGVIKKATLNKDDYIEELEIILEDGKELRTKIVSTPSLSKDEIYTMIIEETNSIEIPDGSVVTSKLSDGAVNSIKIMNGSIVNDDVSLLANIGWSKINKVGSSVGDMDDASTYYEGTYLKLDASNDPITGALLLQNAVDSTEAFRINNALGNPILGVDTVNGRVGMGTINPTAPLQINTNYYHGIKVLYTDALGAASGGSVNLWTNGTPDALNQRLGKVAFGFENGLYNAEPATITSFSDGIFTQGVSHPSRIQFEVAPEGSIYRQIAMVIKNNGNVGIGTTTPSEQLEITKNLRIPLTTYNSGNIYGVIFKDGDPFIHDFNYGNNGIVTTRGRNLFIGKGAGNFTMGSTATQVYDSSDNMGLGTAALRNITTGNMNIGIGNYAGSSIIEGSRNIAIGFAALNSSISGERNIGIGVDAGRFIADGITPNTISNSSIYIGDLAKANIDGGDNEIVIGFNAIGLGNNSVVIGNDSITKTILKGNVGIGTTTPSVALHLSGSTSATTQIRSDIYSNVSLENPTFLGRRSRGTQISPSAVQLGDMLAAFSGRGYGNSGFSPQSNAIMRISASENFTDTAYGTHIEFWTTANGTTSVSEKVRISDNGNVGIGSTNPDARLHINTGADTTKGLIIRANSPTQSVNSIEWQDSTGGVVYSAVGPTGNFGIGASPTDDSKINLQTSMNISSGEYFGIKNRITFTPSSDYSDVLYGLSSGAYTGTGYNYSGQVRGLQGVIRHNGTGTVSIGEGLNVQAGVGENGGTITTLRGISISTFRLSGTVNTATGLYIANVVEGTQNYAIYTNLGSVHFGDSVDISGGLDTNSWEEKKITEIINNLTITASDATNIIFADSSSNDVTVTLPAISTVTAGRTYTIKKISTSNNVYVAPNGTDEIDDVNAAITVGNYSSIVLVAGANNSWYIVAEK